MTGRSAARPSTAVAKRTARSSIPNAKRVTRTSVAVSADRTTELFETRPGRPDRAVLRQESSDRQAEDRYLRFRQAKRCRALLQDLQKGYSGVGPVCWGDGPKGWVNCGMGSATNSGTCASITFGQVAAVGEMALFVGTLGSSSAATKAVTGPQKASKLAKLKKDFKVMKAAFDKVKNTLKMAKAIDKAKKAGKITGAAARGFKVRQDAGEGDHRRRHDPGGCPDRGNRRPDGGIIDGRGLYISEMLEVFRQARRVEIKRTGQSGTYPGAAVFLGDMSRRVIQYRFGLVHWYNK